MYIPKHFKVTDLDEIQAFIHKHSFGTLTTIKNGRPIATHLPLQLTKEGEDYFISGHMAYGNPQWRTFEAGSDVLVAFQGPHAYISSSWYEKENVPTWNYQSVHLYGTARLLDEAELRAALALMMQKYEHHREHPVLWETLSSEMLEKELKGIVGFKIHVTEVQAASKMSQKRNETDYGNIIDHLKKEEHANSSQVAEAMDRKRK